MGNCCVKIARFLNSYVPVHDFFSGAGEGGKDVGGVHSKVALQAPGDACRQDCEKNGECC